MTGQDRNQSTGSLRERVIAAQEKDKRRRDKQGTADLIAELGETTIDGVPLRFGMVLIDYDLRRCHITGIQSVASDGTVWYETSTGMFDAKRLWARMP